MNTQGPDEPNHPLVLELRKVLKDADLLAKLDYIIAENRIYRSKFEKRVPLTEADRHLLVKFGLPARKWLDELTTIVRPETILRWHRRMKQKKWDYSDRVARPGRPRISAETETLVIRMATENEWGLRRIVGELKKVGHRISHGTVANVLRRNGLPQNPRHGGMSWRQFIRAHLDTAWACDFFTEEVWTRAGLVTCYVLFFIHLGTRRVYIANVTTSPNATWTRQQARNFLMHLDDISEPCTHMIHDRDTCLRPMDPVLESAGIKIVRTPLQSPWCNAYAERFVREARETLDSLVVIGERRLLRVVKTIAQHHNHRRPHQGIENRVPVAFPYPQEAIPNRELERSEELGGLLSHYQRQAA